MEGILLFGVVLIVIILLLVSVISILQLLIVFLLFKEFRTILKTKEQQELQEDILDKKNILEQVQIVYEKLSKQIQEAVLEISLKENSEEKKLAEVDLKKKFYSIKEIEKKGSAYDRKLQETQDGWVSIFQTNVGKNSINQIIDKYLKQINDAISKGNYGIYIDNGWQKIGIGDGRRELAEERKIVYSAGNAVVKEIGQSLYLAIPGRSQWMKSDLSKDVMKECYTIKQDFPIYSGNYKIVNIKELAILQKKGDEFIVKKKGEIEVIRIG